MEAIGGYFELELRQGEHYHNNAIKLNSARNCFEYILVARRYKKVYIPYYTCDVMLQPLQRQHVEYVFYHINEDFEPLDIKDLKKNEAFLYTNYFGLKQDCVEKLANIYGDRLIVDNAHSFYAPRLPKIDTIYSPRKFFGVPDGGYLYTDCPLDVDFPRDESWDRMLHLLIRADKGPEDGYVRFRENENRLDRAPIRRMSMLTEKLLRNIDYTLVKKKRKKNYQILDSVFGSTNLLGVAQNITDVPMIYPLYCERRDIRQILLENKIYTPLYWSNVPEWAGANSIEASYARYILPLCVDQRYDLADISRILYNIIVQ